MPPVQASPLAAIADRAARLGAPSASSGDDGALDASLLRLVNSSALGFTPPLVDLDAATQVVGAKTLRGWGVALEVLPKLLETLGEADRGRCWRRTLTLALAARRFAQLEGSAVSGDAFTAGLLAPIGRLALTEQLPSEYASVLAATEGVELRLERAEREALGFTHRELSAELARRWGLPDSVVEAIKGRSGASALGTALRLAELLERIAVGREGAALPALLVEGERACGLKRRQLNSLVDSLQSGVEGLAEAIGVSLDGGADYRQSLVEAQARLSLGGEAALARDQDDRLCEELLLETRRLSAAARALALGGLEPRTDGAHASTGPRRGAPLRDASPLNPSTRHWLVSKTHGLVAACREKREPLSLVLLQLSAEGPADEACVAALRRWLAGSAWGGEFAHALWEPIERHRAAVWMPTTERVRAAKLCSLFGGALATGEGMLLDAGVAGVHLPSRGLEGRTLVEAAERCLAGAIAAAGPTVKSIEVF